MSMDLMINSNEIQHRIMKYFLEKLDIYAHKSHIWQLIHGSHIHRNLLKKSRHLSKIHSISEDLVRQCINQLLTDIDQYVTQIYQLISSHQFNEMISAFKHTDKVTNSWQKMQLERARLVFSNNNIHQSQLNDQQLLEYYYNYIQNKYNPKKDSLHQDQMRKLQENPFDLNRSYLEAENKAKEFLKTFFMTSRQRSIPNIDLIDEMIKLGLNDMKKIPSREDFQERNGFLGRISIFHRAKEAYQCLLKNTSEDFLILRFGRILGRNALSNTSQLNKQFHYLLHSFLKSIFTLLASLTTNTKDIILSSIPKLSNLLFMDDDSSIIKLNFDLFSPQLNIDQWTWLLEQWREILRTMPLTLIESGAFSRVVRTTIGIGLMHLGKCAETMINTDHLTMNSETMNEELFHSLQIGFYFGIAYAVVDSLQDEINHLEDQTLLKHFFSFNPDKSVPLNVSQTVDQWLQIVEQFLCGKDFDRSQFPKTPFTTMLIDSFDNLLVLTELNNTRSSSFHELALLLRSQRIDKKSFDDTYNEEQLYLGSLLKSHFTYTCASHLGNLTSARIESDRLWSIPFLGQLTDDCRDFNDDLKSSSVTPFTYYSNQIQCKKMSMNPLLNPFYTFLNLCSNIYLSSNRNDQTGAFLGRRIARALRSIEMNKDEQAYRYFLNIFCIDNPHLYDYCWNKLRRQFSFITDPEKNFFRTLDSLSIRFSRTNRKFETYVFENFPLIEEHLNITSINSQGLIIHDEQLLLSAMNYSVQAGGKRLRMFLLLIIGELFEIERERILPLACGIEYLHTSSLIFDDLPAQDNSDLRRGRSTLHKTRINNDIPHSLCEGRAQLAAVDLIAISMNTINTGLMKKGFSAEKINLVFREVSQLMHSLCVGQMMDLRAARVGIEDVEKQVDELDRIAWLKTGKTLEAVIVIPAILSDIKFKEKNKLLNRLRDLSRFMGILFQMRDDLLDVESSDTIGKPTSIDIQNNTQTYVSLLGIDETHRRLQQYLTLTLQLVDECWPTDAETVKDVIRHIVSRKA